MENKDLILVGGEKEVYLERRRRTSVRFGQLIFRFLAVLLLVGVIICALLLVPRIKKLFEDGTLGGIFVPNGGAGVTQKPSDTDNAQGGSLGGNNTQNGSGGENNSGSGQGITQGGTQSEEKVPSGAFKINTVTEEYRVTNETKIELEQGELALVSPTEIKNKYGGEAPLVLITHLSPSECYSNGKYYTAESEFYGDGENIAELASELARQLNALGIKTVYLDEEYAKGSALGATREYENAVSNALSRYPSISYVFCLSRGIYINDDMSTNREAVKIDGENYAQIRIVSGTQGDKMTDAQKKNVSFALDFAKFANEKTGTAFVCENKIAPFPLGQNISPLAIEIELGTYASTYDEAQSSTKMLSSVIFEYLSSVGGE